jgi:hypothetical protein
VLQSLGTEYARHDQLEQANQVLQEAIEQQRRVCAQAPKSVPYRHALAESYRELAKVERTRCRLDAAVAAALEAGQRYHDNPAELYKVAVELAQCMNQIGEGQATFTSEQQAEHARYARHTLQALKAAVAAGYRDREALHQEPAFAVLRDREEFRQLLPASRSPR